LREPQSLEGASAFPVAPALSTPNFFSLRRRSCKCFVAASSCFLWKPGVPACTDPVLGGYTALLLCVNGDSPCALCAPLPSLGVCRGSGHVLPLRGPCAPPPSWGLRAWNPASSSVPARPCGLPSHPGVWKLRFSQTRMVGGGPFLLGWIVHMLIIAQTQRHIFIIVIKLYCTKVLGQYLWGRAGWNGG
jgi:hypothetical protein